MRNTLLALVAAVAVAFAGSQLPADDKHDHDHGAHVGDKAPAFSLQDHTGKTVKLADHAGKIVVLEWINPGCPFVVRLGKEQAMKNLADKYKDKDVVWLGVITGDGAKADEAKKWAETASLSYPILLDEQTKVARKYGAKATPHMFVIDKSGKLAYSGAIDNDPDGEKPAGERTNYVAKAIDALLAGQTVATAETKAYGCGVKYK
jgi:peroxiredoxin